MTTLETKLRDCLGDLLLSNVKLETLVEETQKNLKQAIEGHAEVVEGLEQKIDELNMSIPEGD